MESEFRASVDQPLTLAEVKKKVEEKDVKTANTVKCKLDDEGNFIEDMEGDRICKDEAYEPIFKDTELKFETSFVVAVGFDGGVTSTILLSNPRLTSLGPGVTADYDKTRTYKLTVTLPMGTNETTVTESRRLTYCDVSDGPERVKLLCVEEVYDEDRYYNFLSGLNDPLPYGIGAEAVFKALASMLAELQKKVEGEEKSLSEKLKEALKELEEELGGKTKKSFDQHLKKAVTEATNKRDNAMMEALENMLRDALAKEDPVLRAVDLLVAPQPQIERPEDFNLGPVPTPPGY